MIKTNEYSEVKVNHWKFIEQEPTSMENLNLDNNTNHKKEFFTVSSTNYFLEGVLEE